MSARSLCPLVSGLVLTGHPCLEPSSPDLEAPWVLWVPFKLWNGGLSLRLSSRTDCFWLCRMESQPELS